jgi:hypothetical protein
MACSTDHCATADRRCRLVTLLFDVLYVSHGVRAKRCATSPLQGSVVAWPEALGTTRIRDADRRRGRHVWLGGIDEACAAVGCHGHQGRQWFGTAVEYRMQSCDGVGTDIASVDRAGGGALLFVPQPSCGCPNLSLSSHPDERALIVRPAIAQCWRHSRPRKC